MSKGCKDWSIVCKCLTHCPHYTHSLPRSSPPFSFFLFLFFSIFFPFPIHNLGSHLQQQHLPSPPPPCCRDYKCPPPEGKTPYSIIVGLLITPMHCNGTRKEWLICKRTTSAFTSLVVTSRLGLESSLSLPLLSQLSTTMMVTISMRGEENDDGQDANKPKIGS